MGCRRTIRTRDDVHIFRRLDIAKALLECYNEVKCVDFVLQKWHRLGGNDMNKSIFIGDASQIQRVYPDPVLHALADRAGLNISKIYSKAEILAFPADFADTQYLFSTWGFPSFESEEIRTCFPSLKAVFYGAGTVQGFARPFLEQGIAVFSAWAANGVPVAEYTTSQILLANKGFFQSQAIYRRTKDVNKARDFVYAYPGNYGCRVGILGAGVIGKMVLGMLQQFRLSSLVYDPFLSQEQAAALGAKKAAIDEIFRTCQTVSNHVANNAQTVGMIHYGLLSQMPQRATLINTGRGAQIVEADLIRVLTERPDITAVLDVTDPEPPKQDSPLYSLPNVVLTPHIAGSFGDEVHRLAETMLDQFDKFSAGHPTEYGVTLEMLKTMA